MRISITICALALAVPMTAHAGLFRFLGGGKAKPAVTQPTARRLLPAPTSTALVRASSGSLVSARSPASRTAELPIIDAEFEVIPPGHSVTTTQTHPQHERADHDAQQQISVEEGMALLKGGGFGSRHLARTYALYLKTAEKMERNAADARLRASEGTHGGDYRLPPHAFDVTPLQTRPASSSTQNILNPNRLIKIGHP